MPTQTLKASLFYGKCVTLPHFLTCLRHYLRVKAFSRNHDLTRHIQSCEFAL